MPDEVKARRFPPPWTSEETEACFIVRDNTGRALAYVYYEKEPSRRASANLLTKDEARRVASNIAKLPNSEWAARRHRNRAGRASRPAPKTSGYTIRACTHKRAAIQCRLLVRADIALTLPQVLSGG